MFALVYEFAKKIKPEIITNNNSNKNLSAADMKIGPLDVNNIKISLNLTF